MSTNEILEQFGLVRRKINRLLIIYLKEISLGPKQMLLLRFVHKHELCTMTDISTGVGSDKSSVTRMINSLVKTKYLELTYSKDDHRAVLVSLGSKAEKIIPQIEKTYARLSKNFASSLNEQEQTTLLAILKKIEPSLQKTINTAIAGNKN